MYFSITHLRVFDEKLREKTQEILYISPRRSLLLQYREDSRILDALLFIFEPIFMLEEIFRFSLLRTNVPREYFIANLEC